MPILNTVQQLAGAIGTALFITVMSLGIAGSAMSGVAAQAEGIHLAFLVAAIGSQAAIALSALVRNTPRVAP